MVRLGDVVRGVFVSGPARVVGIAPARRRSAAVGATANEATMIKLTKTRTGTIKGMRAKAMKAMKAMNAMKTKKGMKKN